jgi:hypothetical protein
MEIVGYEKYLIYPNGKVASKRFPERYLEYGYDGAGYVSVSLSLSKERNGRRRYSTYILAIHIYVALHYIPNPDNKPHVVHINRNKHDNRVENLRWATEYETDTHRR